MKIPVSIGIMAYNEEKNIGRLINKLLAQKLKNARISEIIIVSSGSTDTTNKIVSKIIQKNKIVKLFIQKKRRGKAAAVNLFLAAARENIVVLMSADILLSESTIERLVNPLFDTTVGIVGSHPVPVNDPATFMGFASHLLWSLHDEISKKTPKMGEMIAFRKIFKKIPSDSYVDEANIEPLIRGQGFKAVYARGAYVYNKGPETISEFINRRRHIYAGHLITKHHFGYEVATLSSFKILFFILSQMKLSWRFLLFTPLVIFLEGWGRFLGFLDFKYNLRRHTVWKINKSTKELGYDFNK